MHPDSCEIYDDTGYEKGTFYAEQRGKGHRSSGVGEGPRITYHIDVKGDFTTATLVGHRFAAVGSAKRNPRDKFNAQVGVDIAMARAYRDLADQLEEQAGRQP